MILLIVFAFIAGVVTILSPCILPVLPIILSSSVDASGKRRPFGVVVGFVLSFTFFTLFLSTLVRLFGIPADRLRLISIFVLVIFGLTLLVPRIQLWIEQLFSRLSSLSPDSTNRTGFTGGLIIGLSLGLLWTPCVGPILASVISLAITGTVTASAVFITLAYSLGTALPMFVIMQAGSTALRRVPWLVRNTNRIQKAFGVLMVLTAIGIYFNVDRRIQSWVLEKFPQYGAGLTRLEDNPAVRDQLGNVSGVPLDESIVGRPMSELMPKGILAPELIVGGEWLNSAPLTLKSLRGKVVLLDFWTYSCINCQRTFPYLKSWWSKYQDKGLVIIGVHSPEFEFEKNRLNLNQALNDFDITYPVMQDNNFATWRAFNNRYWPAKYLLDKDGFIRYTHFGEGAYDQTEKVIQQLLTETGAKVLPSQVNNPEYQNFARTPETYLGYLRLHNFSSPENLVKDKKALYTIPARLPDDTVALGGEWMVTGEYAAPTAGAKLFLSFDAKEVFVVVKPKKSGAKFKVLLDDKTQAFGEDNQVGIVEVDSDRLYRIIKLPSPGQHVLQLEFFDEDLEIYAFTFG